MDSVQDLKDAIIANAEAYYFRLVKDAPRHDGETAHPPPMEELLSVQAVGVIDALEQRVAMLEGLVREAVPTLRKAKADGQRLEWDVIKATKAAAEGEFYPWKDVDTTPDLTDLLARIDAALNPETR